MDYTSAVHARTLQTAQCERAMTLQDGEWIRGLVSVVVPTYNRARFLGEAIDSVLNQTYSDLELLVVDDGSVDETRTLVRHYGDRLRYIYLEGPSGPGAARNRGIRETSGEFIAFLDSDDIWLPHKLEEQVALFRRTPSLGMVGGGCAYINATGERIGSVVYGPRNIGYPDLAVFTAMPGSTSNAVVRRSVLLEVGLFDESLWRAQDRDLWIRISQRFTVECVRRPSVLIRVHPERRLQSEWRDILRYRREIDKRIPDWVLRRKAEAWLWYSLFDRDFQQRGRTALGFYFLTRSFLSYPLRIDPRNRRLRPSLSEVLPHRAVNLLRKVLKRPPR